MELVGDPRKRGAQILAEADFEITAARFLCDACETRIRQVRQQRCLQTARPDAWRPRRELRLCKPIA